MDMLCLNAYNFAIAKPIVLQLSVSISNEMAYIFCENIVCIHVMMSTEKL